jgi:TolA-binding protein
MLIVRSLALALIMFVLALCSAAHTGAQENSSPKAIGRYRAAVAMQNKQMYDLAAQEWATFLKQHPDDPLAAKARHYLGVCYFQQGKFDKAEKSFAAAVRTNPDTEHIAESLLNLGLSQFNRGNKGDKQATGRAIETLLKLTTEHGRSPAAKEAPFYLAESYYAIGELDAALDAYRRALEVTKGKKQRAKVLFGIGVALQDQGSPKKARRIFEELLELKPSRAMADEARMRRADALLASGDVADAAAEFARLADHADSDYADYVRMRLAAAQYGSKAYAQAARSYVHVVEQFPDSEYVAEATVGAGKCFYLAKSYDAARTWLDRAMKQPPSVSAEAAHWLARTELATGHPQQALSIVRSALARSKQPRFEVELRIDQADALYELPDQRKRASESYAEIAARFPDHEQSPHARYMAAYAALETGSVDEALRHVETFLDRHSKHKLIPDVLAIAAESRFRQGEHAEAGAIYTQLARQFKDATDAHLWRVRAALCANLRDDHEVVIKLLRGRAGRIKETDLQGEARFLLGAAYFHKNEHAMAIRELEHSLAVDPRGAQADRGMLLCARSLRQTGHSDQALRLLGELVERFPKSKVLDRALLERAELLAANGDHRQAAAVYERLIDSFANSRVTIDAIYGWGWSLIRGGKFESAKQVFDKLLAMKTQHGRKADCYYARAVALQQLGKTDAALRDVDRYLKSTSGALQRSALADAHYLRGLCLANQQEFDEAIASFKKALRADPKYADADKVLYELAWAQQSARQPDDAAATFRKLTRQFPQSELATETTYRAAEADFAAKKYESAARGFAHAARRVSQVNGLDDNGLDSELSEQILHKLGWSLFHLDRFDEAHSAFEDQLRQFPSQPLAPDAQLMLGECLFKQQEYQGATTAYQQGLSGESKNDPLVALVLLHSGQAAGQRKDWQASVEALDQLLQRFPKSPHALTAEYEKAWAMQNQGQVDRAEELFARVANETNSVLGAKARFMQGETQFLRKNYDDAIRTFFKVAYGYGHPKSPAEFHVWQANAIFEAARCCESTKRLEAAAKLYNELIETHPDSDKARDARRKLEAIAQH